MLTERCDAGCGRHAVTEYWRPSDGQRWVLCGVHDYLSHQILIDLKYLELRPSEKAMA